MSGTAVANLVDLQLELNSLQQGLNQMEKITPSEPFGSKDDPFGDSFTSFPVRNMQTILYHNELTLLTVQSKAFAWSMKTPSVVPSIEINFHLVVFLNLLYIFLFICRYLYRELTSQTIRSKPEKANRKRNQQFFFN